MRNFIALAAGLLTTLAGCWWTDSKKATPAAPDAPSTPRPYAGEGAGDGDDGPGDQPPLDFTGLRGVLAGRWEKRAETVQDRSDRHTIEFTEKSFEERKYGWLHRVGRYEKKNDLLHVTDRQGGANVYGVEFLSDGEIALLPEQLANGTDFNELAGRWRRVSLPPGKPTPVRGTGLIADAQRQVQRIEQKLAKNESILKSALADRDDLVAKLRVVGVTTTADLKGNVRGRRLAENVARLTTEIEGLEQQLVALDAELLKARSVVRRLEREAAGLSDDERRELARQLREAEERTDGSPTPPPTPLDVEAAVEKALTGTPRPATPRNAK